MAKKTTPSIDNTPTELIKTKDEFNTFLDEKIIIGNELLNREIQNLIDFSKSKKDFSNWCDYNSEYLKQAFNKESNEYKKSFDTAGSWSIGMVGGRTRSLNIEIDKFLIKVDCKLQNLKKLRAKTELLKVDSDFIQNTKETSTTQLDKSQVFIVHGHDDEAKSRTARFVERLGFEAIILHEQASSSMSIIEKIEEYSNVGFGIVLYTPCDIGGKKTQDPAELESRARQNVVFEHGFLIGRIKRENVCALVKGDVELPNDISGVVYVQMDSADSWKYTIAKEMIASGYKVDMNKI